MSRYQRPELVPADSLAKVTAEYKKANDARAAKLAKGPAIYASSSRAQGLDDLGEAARCELLALCDVARKGKSQDDDAMRLAFLENFVEAVAEFCTAIGARTSDRRESALDRMREAVASLERYRGDR